MIRAVGFAGLALLALSACGDEEAAPPLPPRPVVSENVSVSPALGPRFVGVVAARVETELGFPLTGRIAERRVDVGTAVEAGDILVQLDPTTVEADLRSAEGGASVARARLKSAEDSAARTRELVGRGVSSASDLETDEQALVAARARLEQAEATLATTRDQAAYATLTAPQAGVISAVFADTGASVEAGQAVLRLSATDEREAQIDLSEQQLAGLAIGTGFDVRLESDPSVGTQGILTSVDPVAERATRTRRLHLTLQEPPPGFRLGALVRVSATAAVTDAGRPSLPQGAVRSDGSVWVVSRPAGSIALVPVTLGDAAGGRVTVTAGLSAGDEVITKGINSLEPGQIVGPQVSR